MKRIAMIVVVGFLIVATGLAVFTRWQVMKLEARFPPVGTFVEADGRKIHLVDKPGPADRLPALFIHGASGNLLDQMHAFDDNLNGERRALFVDRPGHGYSERGDKGQNSLAGQAASYAAVLDELGIEKAIIVCHSMGCASGAAMAIHHPEKVAGLVFLAPATHEWPGGVTWYYSVASLPVIGHLFTETLALPAGLASIDAGVSSVFTPNEAPKEYSHKIAAPLVLRPSNFRNNAEDVAQLKRQVIALSPRYPEIKVPTFIITGDADNVVWPSIHSEGLERDIRNARLIVGEGIGHKPDYLMTDQALSAIRDIEKRYRSDAGETIATDIGDPEHVGCAGGGERNAC